MQIKIKDLKPNPYKKQINNGKFNNVQLEELEGNLDELGLMGAIPVVNINGKYHLVNSHHRVEALKRKYGEDYEVPITVHKYNDDQLLRGMVIENLSQRGGDFKEETENIRVVEKYLNNNPKMLDAIRESRNASPSPKTNKRYLEGEATAENVKAWLKLSDKKWSADTILNIMNIYKKLDKDLLAITSYSSRGGQTEKEHLCVEDAKNLSRIEDKQEQKQIKNLLEKTGLNHEEKNKLITVYKKCDEETQQKVLAKEIDVMSLSLNPNTQNTTGDEPMNSTMMGLKIDRRTLGLINEMRTLRKALYQFRNEKLYDQFSTKQRMSFHKKLSTIKTEYTELIKELDENLEELK